MNLITFNEGRVGHIVNGMLFITPELLPHGDGNDLPIGTFTGGGK